MKRLIQMVTLAAALLLTVSVFGQKYGYVNSAAILKDMPAVQQMQSNLKSFQTQLQKKGQQMVTEYQQKEQEAVTKEERGELSPIQKQKIMEELQEKQEEIMAYEKEMQQKLTSKEQELLDPILEKVNDAIQEVAKENEITFVFDVSSGAILYADESMDLSKQVKDKIMASSDY